MPGGRGGAMASRAYLAQRETVRRRPRPRGPSFGSISSRARSPAMLLSPEVWRQIESRLRFCNTSLQALSLRTYPCPKVNESHLIPEVYVGDCHFVLFHSTQAESPRTRFGKTHAIFFIDVGAIRTHGLQRVRVAAKETCCLPIPAVQLGEIYVIVFRRSTVIELRTQAIKHRRVVSIVRM